MSIARKLVRFWSRLCDQQGARFSRNDSLLDPAKREPEYIALQQTLEKKAIVADPEMLPAMRSVGMHVQELRSELASAELSATFPGGALSSARPTFQIIRDMLTNAKAEVILAVYRVTNREICKLLQNASPLQRKMAQHEPGTIRGAGHLKISATSMPS